MLLMQDFARTLVSQYKTTILYYFSDFFAFYITRLPRTVLNDKPGKVLNTTNASGIPYRICWWINNYFKTKFECLWPTGLDQTK